MFFQEEFAETTDFDVNDKKCKSEKIIIMVYENIYFFLQVLQWKVKV